MNEKTARRTVRIERSYEATLDDVWDLWTTKDGIESWWGPRGFAVTVQELEVRAGGSFAYTMTAIEPEMIAFMRDQGMPVSTPATATFVDVVSRERLAYRHRVDFTGATPYDVTHVIEFHEEGSDVRIVLTIEAMHDEEWTERAVAGWESQLEKLTTALPKTRP